MFRHNLEALLDKKELSTRVTTTKNPHKITSLGALIRLHLVSEKLNLGNAHSRIHNDTGFFT